jgi:hypothetical protein
MPAGDGPVKLLALGDRKDGLVLDSLSLDAERIELGEQLLASCGHE